jgi:ribosomal protein S18 acetylase RimI-like enzyme
MLVLMAPYALRLAGLTDLPALLPRTRALNAHEGIAIGDDALEAALRRLLVDRSLGGAWLIEQVEHDHTSIGYAIATYGFDLEFGGRDAYLTELWIDEPARGRGAATAALVELERALRADDVRALHLQVRPENPALRLYERVGFTRSPRYIMTRRLA